MNNNPTSNFLSMAFDDYIDARLLIRQNRLLNGGHLSALAAEKLLKAIIVAGGLEPKHEHLDKVDKLLNQISKSIPEYRNFVNVEFLRYLGRIFRMRYFTDKNDEQISISRNKLLWEIDRLFDQVHDILRIEPIDAFPSYVNEKRLNNILIYEENQWLLGKREIAELETLPDFLEAVYRFASGITVSVRKELPKTFINCKIGEELIITIGKK